MKAVDLSRPSTGNRALARADIRNLKDAGVELLIVGLWTGAAAYDGANETMRAARDEGMRFLRESAVEQVLKGITTLREINKVTFVE